MNEESIKKIIKLKMDMAGSMIDRLPPEASAKMIRFGRLVLDSLVENFPVTREHGSKSSANHINIE